MTEKSKRKVNFGQFWHAWKGKMWFVISMFFSIEYLSWRIFFYDSFRTWNRINYSRGLLTNYGSAWYV